MKKATGIKKYFLTLSAAALLVLCSQTQAKAENFGYCESDEVFQSGGISQGQDETLRFGQVTSRRYLASMRAVSLEQAIYNGLVLGSTDIDISSYALPVENLHKVYVDILNNNADLFYVDSSWGYSYDNQGYVVTITPSYNMSGSQRENATAEFNREIKYITDQVDESWSDLEKALFYHDYLCIHFEYDNDGGETIYDAYHMLTQKKGVCQAYTLLYNYLLKQEGIEGAFALSDAMNHIWNIVNINGKWYHTDVTWDDPLSDAAGRSCHYNFLRSDAGISSQNHYSWTADYSCTAADYDSAFWNVIDTPFVFGAGQWYCVDKDYSAICECDVNTVSLRKVVYSIDCTWYTEDGTGIWSGIYSGIGLYDGKIYFNSASDLYSWDIFTGQVTKVYTPVLSGNQRLYGLYLDRNIIKYSGALSPNDERRVTGTYTLPEETDPPQLDISVAVNEDRGDVVCSGKSITPKKLRQYFGTRVTVYHDAEIIEETREVATGDTIIVSGNDAQTYTIIVKGDVNGDAVVSVLDMEAIQKDILKIKVLSGAYLQAGQLNNISTGSLSVLDMEIIQKYILGLGDLS